MKSKAIQLPEIPTKLSKAERIEARIPALEKILGKPRKDFYRRIQDGREDEWYEIVHAFEANQSFYNAYRYLQYHPVFWYFHTFGDWETFHERQLCHDSGVREGLDFTILRVDPATGTVSDDPILNTRVLFCYEFMMTCEWRVKNAPRLHCWKLDSGAATYERAIIKAAKRLHRSYGNDRQKLKKYDEAPESAPVSKPVPVHVTLDIDAEYIKKRIADTIAENERNLRHFRDEEGDAGADS